MAVFYESYYGVMPLQIDVVVHHGIKGQKWGIRRFQNPDRTWTEAGKQRYGTEDGDGKGKRKEKKKGKESIRSTAKSVGKMSDDELMQRVGRLRKEKELLDLQRSIEDYKTSTGSKILRQVGKTAVTTLLTAGAIYGGKVIIKNTLNKFGVDGGQVIKEMFPKKK